MPLIYCTLVFLATYRELHFEVSLDLKGNCFLVVSFQAISLCVIMMQSKQRVEFRL